MYAKYKPLFKELKTGVKTDSLTAISYFYEITENLVDHHYCLTLFTEGGYDYAATLNPGQNEIATREYYHEPLDLKALESIVEDNVKSGRIERYCRYNFKYENLTVFSYLLDGNIAYLYISAFKMDNHINDTVLQETLNNFYDIINSTDDLKGIIIDIRNNSGGYLNDIYLVVAPLTKEDMTFGYTRSKIGMGRYDYSPWSPMTLYPSKVNFYEWAHSIERDLSQVPVVGIIDLYSMSMAEITAMAIDELPCGSIAGERSFGAHGPLTTNYTDHFTGSLMNRAFNINTSTLMVKRTDGKCYEGIGIIPDIEALYDEERFLSGEDTQLEAAVQYLKSR